MAKKKNSLSGFDGVLNDLGYSNIETTAEVSDMDVLSEFTDVDIPESDNNDDEEKPVDKPTEEPGNPREDNSEIPESVLNGMNNQASTENEVVDELNETIEITDSEKEQVGAFFDAFAEALHWDVEDDERPDSIEGIIDYISSVVEENSKPQYADNRIEELDRYVKNGGRFEDFYNNMSNTISYESLDMEDETNQKTAVRDYLKLSGYTDEQINRKIERYEDADVLEEEAYDALDRLKQIKQKELEEQSKRQEELRIQQEESARKFVTDLSDNISSLTNIRGISIPKEDRRALYEYITKTDKDGLTQYQKDFNENMINNLIESAYFTMKGDALLGSAKRDGQTSAANKLRTILKHLTKNHTKFNAQDEKQRSVVDIASRWL